MYPTGAKLTRVVDAAVEPLTVEDAKNYLRLPASVVEDDLLIADLIVAARMECERLNDRSFVATTWKLTLDFLPLSIVTLPGLSWGLGGCRPGHSADGSIVLPMPPLIAVSSVAYLDQGGTSRTLDLTPVTGDVVVSPGTPGRIFAPYGRFFPLSQPRLAAVEVTYTAGYGTTAAAVPRNVVQAIRLLVSHYYEHRSSNEEVPDAVMNLLAATAWGGYA